MDAGAENMTEWHPQGGLVGDIYGIMSKMTLITLSCV